MSCENLRTLTERVRKHRAPKGALRPITTNVVAGTGNLSESTERQKVH